MFCLFRDILSHFKGRFQLVARSDYSIVSWAFDCNWDSTYTRKMSICATKFTKWKRGFERPDMLLFVHLHTAIFNPNKAALAALCLASFFVRHTVSLKNRSVVTTTDEPKPPRGLVASEYFGWLILFFWQYWFKILTQSTKASKKR